MIPMRRPSRAMSADWALQVFDHAPYITVGFADHNGEPYVLPLTLVRTDDKTFYFHCAMEGHKIDLLRENPHVCLSAVTRCKPTVGPHDGSFTMEYQSAIAYGIADQVTDPEEKIAALRAICLRFLPHNMNNFDTAIARSLSRTNVIKITLTEPPTGKRKQYDSNGNEMRAN